MRASQEMQLVLKDVHQEYQGLLGYISASYWDTLWTTYSRTVQDVSELVERQLGGSPRTALSVSSPSYVFVIRLSRILQ